MSVFDFHPGKKLTKTNGQYEFRVHSHSRGHADRRGNAAFETGIENPLDAAIVAAGESGGLATRGFTKIDEIPYDFLRRRLTIVVAEDGAPTQHLIVAKGAFSTMLDT